MAKKFNIDARLILQLGRDSIKDHTTALVELIKNSFDADASKVEVEIYCNEPNKRIRVADNGFGMTGDEIDDNWLRIGFSEKRKARKSAKGRRKTGEKGIGRIAADRLGASLQVITKSKDAQIQGIEIDWNAFDVDQKSIGDVEIKVIETPVIKIPQKTGEASKETGTELLIHNLREIWTEDHIKRLYRELSFFSPLFSEEFEIEIKNDVAPAYSKVVQTAIYDTAEIEIDLYYDGLHNLIYTFKNRHLPEKNKIEEFELSQFLLQHDLKSLTCGPINLKLYFFVRKSMFLSGTAFKLDDLKDFLNENSGIKLYRDNIVVKPYGFIESSFGHDWLGLDSRKAKDPSGLSRDTYKVNANNIVGIVNFSRDSNSQLIDSASREGLVENESFEDLKGLINASIVLLESYRIDLNRDLKKSAVIVDSDKSTNDYIKKVKSKLNSVITEISEIQNKASSFKELDIKPLLSSVEVIENVINETEQTFEELLDEKRVLSALATLGISSAVFGHETERAITTFKDAANNAKDFLSGADPEIEVALEELATAVRQAKLVSSWGVFALSRIEKDKRIKRLRSVTDIIERVTSQLRPAFDALGITLKLDLKRVKASTFAMDIESILINLLTNAFSAIPNSANDRAIKIFLDHESQNGNRGMILMISDSGPGISKEYEDKIWEPLFTTKIGKRERQSGTGLGLTIVKSIVTELGGTINLDTDKEIGGAMFKIWLPR